MVSIRKDFIGIITYPAHIASGFMALVLSTSLILGNMLDNTGQVEWTLVTALTILLLTLVFFLPFQLIFIGLDSPTNHNSSATLKNRSDPSAHSHARHFRQSTTSGSSYRAIPLIWLVCILLPQFLLFLICYPGIYGYDGPFHIWQIIHSEGAAVVLNKGYSVPYTLYLSFFIGLGKTIHNVELGFAFAMSIQMLFLCWVSWKICLFVREYAPYSTIKQYGTLLFSSLCPPILCLRISSCQDAPFAGFFCLIVMELIALSYTPRRQLSFRRALRLGLFLLAAFLLRNNMAYAFVILLIPIIILALRRRLAARTVLTLIIPFLTAQIIMGPIYSALGISDGMMNPAIREILSVPSQQLSRSYVEKPESLSTDLKSQLKLFYPDQESFSSYWTSPELADNAKRSLDVDYTATHIKDYIQMYIQAGIADPEDYIEAFLMNSLGYWYIGKTYQDPRMYHPYFEYNNIDALWWNEDYTPIYRNSIFPEIDSFISEHVYNGLWNRVPLLSLFNRAGAYFSLFVFAVIHALHTRDGRALLPLCLLGGLYITLFLSPVCLFRYIFGIALSTPLLLLIINPQRVQTNVNSISTKVEKY